jgi:hypothetical protein
LPKSAAAALGTTSTSERFQLVGFDGTVSESEAVRADLVFLGRRFRGQYLLVDSAVGVLGRDVLNHIRLILDGPAGNWEEGQTQSGEG